MTFNKKYKYDGEMDKEVINLCNAINSLPGIETTGSCCGHEKSVFRIYFQVTSLPQGLFFLARCCDLRYFKHEWKIEVEVSDAMRDNILPTTFWLHSINKGYRWDSLRNRSP